MNWNDMIYILPEVILTIGASVMLLAARFCPMRHEVHVLGRTPHHDLPRPRAALAFELHPGRLLQERAEIDRSGDEVLHPRRRQFRDSALRNLADLRRLRVAQSA